METCLLFPSQFAICDSSVSQQIIRLRLISHYSIGVCPLCQQSSNRIYSYYYWKVADLPINEHYNITMLNRVPKKK